MRITTPLPTPSATELAHSQKLSERIHAAIQAQNGVINFRQFMQMALYEPGLGYYMAGQHKLGSGGDFTTAPELTPLFSYSLARQCAQFLQAPDYKSILELGAGSGKMAADLLQHLETLNCLPQQYFILEISPELRQRQANTLKHSVPHLLECVHWLDQLPSEPLNGVILGNEVLDAFPVYWLQAFAGQWQMLQVSQRGQTFQAHPTTLDADTASALPDWLHALAAERPDGYLSEYNPTLTVWLHSMAACLQRGALILIDYGYERHDYYHPQRHSGTLLCHYRQHVHHDPLLYPGLQDITASVDFTAVAEAGEAAGLTLAGYTHQAAFLSGLDLETLFSQQLEQYPEQQYALAQQIRLLTLPSEMGERFKAIAFTKGFTAPLDGFRLASRMHRL